MNVCMLAMLDRILKSSFFTSEILGKTLSLF